MHNYPGTLPLTIIIPTKNEEKNISDCLKSISWADQIFVVDSKSQDQTAQIARELGATVIEFVYDGGWPKKKNWAIRNLPIRNDWFMILDADERISPELAQEIGVAIKCSDISGYYVRWKFIFLGRWMRYCWRHGWMLRLVKKGKGEYEDLGMRSEGGWDNEVHENILVDGKTAYLHNWLIHNSNETLSYWIKKQNEFSDWNAKRRIIQEEEAIPHFSWMFSSDKLNRRKWFKALYIRLPFKPILIFLYLYIYRLGFLDGKEGFYFCCLRSVHEFIIQAKIFEFSIRKNNI